MALFRLATLGGTLGGFDNDHFVHFAHAKQVQAGERPLRDFLGVALQGAWPTLGYGLSAAGQALLGNNLRSEAWVTAGALGLAAALTFVAASSVAPPGWAIATTLLSVLVAPKLYSYPKVLLLSAAAVLLVAYGRRPTWPRVAGLAVLTAASFLFRNDYAVYVGVGAIGAMLAARVRNPSRIALRHTVAYVLLTLALLTPSLVYVQRHRGLVAYLQDVQEESSREAARTEVILPTFSLGALADEERNATAWLYWLLMLLPAVMLIEIARTWQSGDAGDRAALVGLAAMALVAGAIMLRGNFTARFGDVAPVAAVLGAVVCARAVPRPPGAPAWLWIGRVAAVGLVLSVTTASVWTVASVDRELRTAGWPNWPVGLLRRAVQVSGQLSALPDAYWTTEDVSGTMLLVQYLNRCTHARDRVLLLSYAPELLPLSGRLFAGGVTSVLVPPHTPENDQRILLLVRSQPVPVVLADDEQMNYAGDPFFPRLHEYVWTIYARAGQVRVNDNRVLHVFADRRRVRAGTFRDTGLPCFR